MANKLYNDTSIKAIANAIRAKNGKTDTYTVGEMAGAINDIPVGSGIERVEWHQCPEVVRNYLAYVAEHPYSDDNMDVTYIDDYAPSTPVDANSKPIAETVTGDGYRNAVPNIETPFSSGDLAGTIKPLDHLRWINTTSIPPAQGESYPRGKNTRDLGGWACDGGTVKYGMLIRGSEPNPADKELMVNQIGIKTEVQLLPLSEQTDAYKMKSVWGIDWAGNDTNDSVYGLENPTLLVKIIRDIINSVTHDKPVYFHCGVGADRTGWIAMVLEAILGVSRCDMDIDFELTDFALGWQSLEGGIYRSRSYPTHRGLIEECYAVPLVGGLTSSFQNHIISYLIANGLTIDEINALRHTCINGTPTDIAVELNEYSVTNDMTHVTTDNPATTAVPYQPYQAKITADTGYVITGVDIKVGGVPAGNFEGKQTNLYRKVTKTLTHCSGNNSKISVIDGEGYGEKITPDPGYTLDGATVSIKIGGVEMTTQYFSEGMISIPVVNGDVEITVTAVSQGPHYTNLAKMNSSDWKTGYRQSSSAGGISPSSANTTTNTFYCPVGSVIRVKNFGNTSGVAYDVSLAYSADGDTTGGAVAFESSNFTYDAGTGVFTATRSSGDTTKNWVRLSGLTSTITGDVIITVDEEITA